MNTDLEGEFSLMNKQNGALKQALRRSARSVAFINPGGNSFVKLYIW